MNVWILVFYLHLDRSGGPAIIDNIATAEECQRVQALVMEVRRISGPGRCIEVRKVK